MQSDFCEALKEDWKPVSKPALIAWLVFYAAFIVHAIVDKDRFLIIDYVFLPIHEGGHLLFGWLGQTIGVMGGTILQLFVPMAVTAHFVSQRHLTGTAFAAFFFFENFLNISVYMADARRHELQYVTVGDAATAEHDWTYLFIKFGVLEHDTGIAAVVRMVGWLGMLGVVAWLWWRARCARPMGEL